MDITVMGFQNLKPTLSKNACMVISQIIALLFLGRRFLNIFPINYYVEFEHEISWGLSIGPGSQNFTFYSLHYLKMRAW